MHERQQIDCPFKMIPTSCRLNDDLLDLHSQITVQDIELCLTLLSERKFSKLRCAHKMGFLPPFATARLIQFLQTWAQSQASAVCLVHCSQSDAHFQLPSFASTPHGIACLSLSDSVESLDGRDISDEAFPILEEHLRNVEGEFTASDPQLKFDLGRSDDMPVRGNALFLTAQDTPKVRLSKWLYNLSATRPKPRGGDSYDLMVGRIVREATKELLGTNCRLQLGTIFSEVFENTDNWGRTELDGNDISRSLRCVHFRVIEEIEGQDSVSKLLRGSDFIGEYVERMFPMHKKARFLELSIVDGGVGYAPRLAKKPLENFENLDEEFKSLRNCLCNQGTSGSAARAHGLVKACKAANALEALLAIRSGHLSLYRDFSKTEHRLAKSSLEEYEYFTEEDARLYDAASGTDEIRANPKVSGVAYSLLIPFR